MELELLRANLVRTLVPVLVGAVVTVVPLLAEDKKQAALYPIAAAAVTWVYYAVVRVAETRYPQLWRLLGTRQVKPGAAAGPREPGDGGVAAPGRDRVELAPGLAHGAGGLGVRLGGVPVHGVESVELTGGEGRTTVLTLRIRDPRVEILGGGAPS